MVIQYAYNVILEQSINAKKLEHQENLRLEATKKRRNYSSITIFKGDTLSKRKKEQFQDNLEHEVRLPLKCNNPGRAKQKQSLQNELNYKAKRLLGNCRQAND